jgi:glycosyltransferase, group 2 family
VTPSDSQRWHLNSARQIRNTFGIDLRYADPRDSVRGIVRGPGRSVQNTDDHSVEKQDAEKSAEKTAEKESE